MFLFLQRLMVNSDNVFCVDRDLWWRETMCFFCVDRDLWWRVTMCSVLTETYGG